MIVRAVVDEDFEAIAAITNEYILKTAIHFGTKPVAADELRTDWRATRDRYAFVVADDGGVVGFAKAMTFRTRPAYAWTAEVGVYVNETHQRRGVARALYTRLFDACRAQGFHLLVAGIALPNDASVRLHEAMGFAHVGTFPEVGFKFGAFHDVGFWTLRISTAVPPPALRPPEVNT